MTTEVHNGEIIRDTDPRLIECGTTTCDQCGYEIHSPIPNGHPLGRHSNNAYCPRGCRSHWVNGAGDHKYGTMVYTEHHKHLITGHDVAAFKSRGGP